MKKNEENAKEKKGVRGAEAGGGGSRIGGWEEE